MKQYDQVILLLLFSRIFRLLATSSEAGLYFKGKSLCNCDDSSVIVRERGEKSKVYPPFKNKTKMTVLVQNLLEITNNTLLENGWILLHISTLNIYSA